LCTPGHAGRSSYFSGTTASRSCRSAPRRAVTSLWSTSWSLRSSRSRKSSSATSRAVRARTRAGSPPDASPRISRARPSTKEASLRTYSGAASLRMGYFWPRISMSTRCFSAILKALFVFARLDSRIRSARLRLHLALPRLHVLLDVEPVQLLENAVHLGQHFLTLLPQARELGALALHVVELALEAHDL